MSDQGMERIATSVNLMFLKRFAQNLETMYQQLFSLSKYRFISRRKIIKKFKKYLADEIKYGNPFDPNLEVLKKRLWRILYELEKGKKFAESDFKLIYRYLMEMLDELIAREENRMEEITR